MRRSTIAHRRGVRAALVAALMVLVAFSTVFSALPRAGAQDRLSIATGGTAGVYYPYGGALANLISDEIEGVDVTAEVTAASVDNMLLIESQDADLAFVLADTAADAAAGREPFPQPIPAQTLATLYDNYTHVVTTANSGIETLADLAGKRVSTGSAGSGTEVIANRLLAAAGVADFQREQLGAGESADAIRDGQIDAFFWSGGLRTGAIIDFVTSPNGSLVLVLSGEPGDELLAEHYAFMLLTRMGPVLTLKTTARQ